MEQAHAAVPYRTYWIAWVVLLGITLLMVLVTHRAVLLAGIVVKATIIALWFMHLRYERIGLTLVVLLAMILTTLALFGLIVPDGLAM